jgi:nitroreductase
LGGALAADVSRRILLGLCKANGRFLVDLDAVIPNVRPEGPKNEVAATPPLDPQTMAAEAAAVEAEWPSGVKPSFDEVREVAAAGMMAPSAGNCQPWKFYWGGKGLHLFHDRSRSTGDFNYEAAQLALGSAWENCALESQRLGWDVEAQVRADGSGSPLTISFAFVAGRHVVDPLVQHIASRHTVRALTSRKPVEAAILQSLSEAGSKVPGADVTWLTSDDELLAAGELAGSADRIRFLDSELHRQLMTELRFRRDEVQATRDGIDVETLGLSCEDQAAMELLRSTEGMRYLREWNAGANLKKMSAKAIAAASAVGLLTMPAVPGAFLHAGRALQRIWLKATSLNMGLHPMAGLPFLLARLTRGNGLGLQESTRGDLRRILPVYQDLFRIEPGRVDVILFRLQCGIPKAPRSVRKPLEEMFITQPVT